MLTPRFEYGVAQKNAPPGQPLQSSIARMGKRQCEATRNWRQADAWAMAWQPRSRQRAGWTRIRRPRGARRESRSQQKSCKNKRIGGVWQAMARAFFGPVCCLIPGPAFLSARDFQSSGVGASHSNRSERPSPYRAALQAPAACPCRGLTSHPSGSWVQRSRHCGGGRQACLSNFATHGAPPCHSLKSRMH